MLKNVQKYNLKWIMKYLKIPNIICKTKLHLSDLNLQDTYIYDLLVSHVFIYYTT